MRIRSLVPAALLITVAFAAPGTAQDATANPLSACFRVELDPDQGDTPPRIVEFIFDPGHAWEEGFSRTWRLEGPARADEIAIWWREDEELVAVWVDGEEEMRTLRLLATGDHLTGTATATLPPHGDPVPVTAEPVDCSASSGRSGR